MAKYEPLVSLRPMKERIEEVKRQLRKMKEELAKEEAGTEWDMGRLDEMRKELERMRASVREAGGTVEDARNRLAELENVIRTAIRTFEIDTGLIVEDIGLSRATGIDQLPELVGVRVTAKLHSFTRTFKHPPKPEFFPPDPPEE